MKERLMEFLHYLRISQKDFEDAVGLARGYVNNFRDNITVKTIEKIGKQYPELNTGWLMFGEGEMLKNTQHIGDNNSIVGGIINGSGNVITNNDIKEFIKIQKGYQERIQKKDEQIDRLLSVIEELTNK
jgi:transcriptional regulator with XRE-family HTH domain